MNERVGNIIATLVFAAFTGYMTALSGFPGGMWRQRMRIGIVSLAMGRLLTSLPERPRFQLYQLLSERPGKGLRSKMVLQLPLISGIAGVLATCAFWHGKANRPIWKISILRLFLHGHGRSIMPPS